MAEPATLTYKINNTQSVELADLTASLTALARLYQKHTMRLEGIDDKNQAKLYVSEIRTGSIIAILMPYIENAGPIAEHVGGALKEAAPYADGARKILEFGKYLKTNLDELKNGKKPTEDVTTKDLKDMTQILEPVSKDSGSSLVINASDHATVNVTVNYNSIEANAIQNQALKNIELMKEPEQKRYNRQLMYWHVASKGKSSKTNDKVIIESITAKPMPVIIEDEGIKQKMMAGRENPFLIGFIVDIELLIVRGDIRGYSVLALHGVLEDDEVPEELTVIESRQLGDHS